MTRRIILASPREPSGVTWLINCFLELGVRCFRGSARAMWQERGGQSHLVARERVLHRWMPALRERDGRGFRFRPDVEVLWHHDWPDWRHGLRSGKVVFFVRDPRDALYSRYRRDNPELSFAEYADTLDAYSLLDRVDTWALFLRSWLAAPGAVVCRFDDYKRDAVATLEVTLAALGLSYPRAELERACAASTFERARDAEQAYLQERPEERVVTINRAGQVGSWAQLSGSDAAVLQRLETRAADVLSHLGYAPGSAPDRAPELRGHVDRVPWLRAMRLAGLLPAPTGGADASGEALRRAERFAAGLDARFLERAMLEPNVEAALLCNLEEVVGRPLLALRPGRQDAVNAYRYELLKRTRDPRVLRRMDPLLLARRLADRARRLLAGR